MTTTEKKSPIEVWLRQENMTIACTVVYQDESTEDYEVNSLSMRGAQREMTGFFIREGYQPLGRWAAEVAGLGGVSPECSRTFKL